MSDAFGQAAEALAAFRGDPENARRVGEVAREMARAITLMLG